MDLHISTTRAASTEERAAVDAVAGSPAETGRGIAGGHAARARRHLLLPALHSIQDRVGWISPGALAYLCERLSVPPADAYGVATFYERFSLDGGDPVSLHVCDDIVCSGAGAERVCLDLEAAGVAGWRRSACLGMCERAPAALVTRAGPPGEAAEVACGPIDAAAARAAAAAPPAASQGAPIPQAGQPGLRLLRRVDRTDPGHLGAYRAAGGYAALRRAIELGPEGVIREVIDSRLVGRGGAAFPTGRKWDAVARAPARPHHLVCNADESEPGTFKDRVLMERDPFALIEAMTVAAFATGCERGFVYVRAEYPLARERLEGAAHQARAHGLLGENVMGAGFAFDVEIRRGAGAYVCGEETALFNSIEGGRGEPRNKPPFPVQAGLFGRPTVVNNVETLVNVLDVVNGGGPAYAGIGTPESTGSKLFCLSGAVVRPGLYEVDFGVTLGELIALAGGVAPGHELRAVLLGGAAGAFVTPADLDLPLTFEGTRARGATLGSGAVVVFDETTDLRPVLVRIARFFRDESCGQCVPCRVGTQRQLELVERLVGQRPLGSRDDELRLFADVAQVMRDASICGLGQTAAGAIESAINRLGVL